MKSVNFNIEINLEDDIADAVLSDMNEGSFTDKLEMLLTRVYSGGHIIMHEELESIIADILDEEEEDGDNREELSERENELISSTVMAVIEKLKDSGELGNIVVSAPPSNQSESAVYSEESKPFKSNIINFNNEEILDASDDSGENTGDGMSDDEADELADLFGF